MSPRSVELLSVVVPIRDNEGTIMSFWERIRAGLEGLSFELILVDDGSRDGSRETLSKLSGSDTRAKVVMLSRRFGRDASIRAGLDHASGNVIAILGHGLRDGPERIPELLGRWRAGTEVAQARRVLVTDRRALAALPSRAQRRLASARRVAFSCCGLALLALLAVVVARLAYSDLRGSALLEGTVLTVAAVQLALIGVVAEHLPSRADHADYVVSERRNIAPPAEPVSELEELVSELDLER